MAKKQVIKSPVCSVCREDLDMCQDCLALHCANPHCDNPEEDCECSSDELSDPFEEWEYSEEIYNSRYDSQYD